MPGFCRRAKSEAEALAALDSYRPRLARLLGTAAPEGGFEIVGRVPGGTTTDFGAPGSLGPGDEGALEAAEAARLATHLDSVWAAFDRVVAGAPAELRKGPRGGGRDRDAVAEHVREAERSYASRLGLRLPPRTPWPSQRQALVAALREGTTAGAWPPRYGVRRIAWHVLDHAWEIEDRSPH